MRVRAAGGRAPERGRRVSRGRREAAEPEAPRNGVVATNQVGDWGAVAVFSAPVIPNSATPKPLEIDSLS